jgi:flagellar hook-associated protein 2
MGRITSGVGLVSGINSKDIIDQLMALEAKPKDLIQKRIDSVGEQKLAYTDLQTRLTTMRISASSFKKPSFFEASTATSSDEDVLTATATNGAAVGSFQFQVARLVTTQQTVSRGFVDFSDAKVGAGTITIEQGGGDLTRETLLSELNGGAGVRRGTFRVIDRSGASATIDATNAVSLDDVIKKINTSLGVQVKATVSGDKLVLTDQTGKTTSDLIVQDIGDGHAAADLGIVGDVANDTKITGTDINFLSRDTNLSQINDGRGIRTAASGNDIAIDAGGGPVEISLANKKTLGEVIDAINTAGGTSFKAELVAGENGIKITNTGGGSVTVSAVGTSKAAADLGILGTGSGSISGQSIVGGIDTVLLSSLNGGNGLTLGHISIQSRAASSAADIDLSSAKTVQDVLDDINNANAGVKASLNQSGDGIQITDTSNGTGHLIITDGAGGTSATDLGINGDFDTNTPLVKGKNLQRAWVSENTLLSQYNGGRGVTPGRFKITNGNGKSATVDLTQGNEVRLGDVIAEINAKDIGVTARINDHGDGLLLEDTSGGAGKLKVEEDSGTTAADLNIKGESADGVHTIDGSMEKTITVLATDTLGDVQKKIQDTNWGVTAQIINDGSGNAPYRLSLNAKNSGRAGHVVIDTGATTLDTHDLVAAQDAAVFLGSAGSDQPLLLTASKNSLAGVIKGVNVELHGVSDKPVTLNVTRDSKNISDEMQKFVDAFNEMADKIKDLTKFDTDTEERGLLLGETTIQTIQSTLYNSFQTVVNAGGKYRVLADVGLKIGDEAKLEFDADKFSEAYADDPDSVQKLFTTFQSGLAGTVKLSQLNDGAGVRHADNGQPDLAFTLKNGSTFNASVGDAVTLNDVIASINGAGAGKVQATIGNNNNLIITDLTTGTGSLQVQPAGVSQALVDLGLRIGSSGGVLTGNRISFSADTSKGAGVGVAIEAAINKLIDPASGVITRQNKGLDEKTLEFKDRVKDLDKLIEAKRTRLEKQFADMESVLSGLQGQQQAIGQIKSVAA